MRPQDPQLLLARNGGKPPLTMQAFTKLADAGGRGVGYLWGLAIQQSPLGCSAAGATGPPLLQLGRAAPLASHGWLIGLFSCSLFRSWPMSTHRHVPILCCSGAAACAGRRSA